MDIRHLQRRIGLDHYQLHNPRGSVSPSKQQLIHRRPNAVRARQQHSFSPGSAQVLISLQANHVARTGLPTLRLARDRLDQAIAGANRHQCKAAVIFVDLDGFKAANGSHGHETGDFVRKEVAERMRTTLRAVDTAARQGGDEFVVILNEITSCDDAVPVP